MASPKNIFRINARSQRESVPEPPPRVVPFPEPGEPQETAPSSGDFQKIVDTALHTTSAEGAALALKRGDAVECVTRSGELAPPTGSKLDVNSGISGESYRKAEAVCCEDTESDLRVDRNLCRALGVRSIAIAPVCEGGKAIGILEVLSSRPSVFMEKHLEILRQLAGVAAGGDERKGAPSLAATAPSETAVETGRVASRESELVVREPATAPHKDFEFYITLSNEEPEKLPWKRIALVGITLLLVALIIVLAFWHRPKTASAAPPSPASTVLPEPADTSAATEEISFAPIEGAKLARARFGNEEANDVTVWHLQPVKPDAIVSTEEVAAPSAPGSAEASRNLVASLITTPNRTMPNIPVSQGVTGGNILHRVAPVYPVQAAKGRVEGRVVLRAEVTEDGSLDQVVALSGSPLLMNAAVKAVRQWKYEPYQLDGKPVRRETRINVDFKLP